MKSRTPTTSRLAIALLLTLIVAGLALQSQSRFVRLFSTRAEAAAAIAVPPAFVDQSFVRKLDIQANDLVVDPATQTIYASLSSSNGANGNSIAPINPNTGTLGTPVFVGSEPNKLAISDNSQFIYVGLNGAFAVRRFDVLTQTAGPQFSIGSDFFNGPNQAGDLAVQPANPHTVAVNRPGAGTIAIFDDGVQRPTVAAAPSNASLVFSTTDLTRLYALGTSTLNKLTVTGNGVASVIPQAIAGSGAAKLSGGTLYTSSGHALDPETGSLLGTFTGVTSGNTTAFVPDSTVHRVYFLTAPFSSGGPVTVTLRVYDQQTFLPLGTLDILDVLGTPTEMVRWGVNGLAFCTTGGNVFLIQTTLVSNQEPIPTPTPTPTPKPPATPTPTPIAGELREVALATNDLAIAPGAQTIFASVPSSAGANGNSVTLINAAAGTTGTSVFIGSEPNKLALSSDGGTLWVALDGANAVRKFDVPSRTAGLQFSLGSDPSFGPYQAEDMAVAPGQASVLAVSRMRPNIIPHHGDVAVFDNGVQRTLTVPNTTNSNAIEFSQSPEVLYGQDTASTEFGFSKMAVASCGCIVMNATQKLVGTSFGDDFRVDNGLVYSDSGRVVDPETKTVKGTFAIRNPNSAGNFQLVAPDSKAGRVYFVLEENGNVLLRVFDPKTFLKIGELQLPGVTGPISSLFRWGTNGLAFRNSSQVFLLQNALIGGQDPQFVAAPPPPSPTMTATVQVITSSSSDPSGVTIAVTGSLTTSGSTDANGVFTITGIPPCGTFTVTASKTNYLFDPPVTVTNPAASSSINIFALHKTIGFITSTASQSEQIGRIFIAVTRNTSAGAASVNYLTIAGTASDRSDFNTTLGRLDFAANETLKTIQILLTDDALVEGPEQFTVVLENPNGADLDPNVTTATITINDNDSIISTVSPLSNAQFFVRQQYQDFLNRAAADDPAGFAFWTNEITSCNNLPDPAQKASCLAVKRINVSAAFFLSIEFQETGYFVDRLYTSSFPASASRPRGLPRFTEFLTDTQQIGQGIIVGSPGWEQKLAQNKQQFVLSWVSRAEFLAEHPLSQTAAQFVDSLFQNNGVTPTTAERSAAITLFAAGDAAGRAAALKSVAESQSVNNKQFNPAFVLMQYFGYLRRNPDDAPDNNFNGYQFWLDKLNQFNGDFDQAEMVKAFLTSIEYQQRFGPTTFDLSQ